jgi:hypothetical protein
MRRSVADEASSGYRLDLKVRGHGRRVHTNLGVTSVYLQRIDNAEIIATVYGRKVPEHMFAWSEARRKSDPTRAGLDPTSGGY